MEAVLGPLFRRVLWGVPGVKPYISAISRAGIKRDAEALAASMAQLHGGTWIAQLDHEAGFILVRPLAAKALRS